MKIMNNPETGQPEEYTMIQLDMPPKGGPKKQPSQREKFLLEEKRRKEAEEAAQKAAQAQNKKSGPLTKRQKHKLDKIKKKYKDQDEEERELRLQLLGVKKEAPKIEPERPQPLPRPQKELIPDEKSETEPPKSLSGSLEKLNEQPEEGPEDVPEDEEADQLGDLAVFETLTMAPLSEDTLLFVVPVCAPYSTMQKFKYKVKITPGTGKRGKAAKAALGLFQRDKTASVSEKTLIKGLATDNFVAQNIPAKVRVSAPQLLRSKK